LPDSPAFARTYDLLLWLVPRTLKFPRQYRFNLAHRIQDAAHGLQRALLEAALAGDPRQEKVMLQRADVELSALRLHLRLSHDLKLLDRNGYKHTSLMLAEIGRLLGGWQKKNRNRIGTEGQL
jgi:hypothetical protein